jgi:hypothetical protein
MILEKKNNIIFQKLKNVNVFQKKKQDRSEIKHQGLL